MKLRREKIHPDYVTAFAHGLTVMRAMTHAGGPVTLAALARSVKLPRATVRRALITLVTEGYAIHQGCVFWLSARVEKFTETAPDLVSPALREQVARELATQKDLPLEHKQEAVHA